LTRGARLGAPLLLCRFPPADRDPQKAALARLGAELVMPGRNQRAEPSVSKRHLAIQISCASLQNHATLGYGAPAAAR
jgi:hypothetical protein